MSPVAGGSKAIAGRACRSHFGGDGDPHRSGRDCETRNEKQETRTAESVPVKPGADPRSSHVRAATGQASPKDIVAGMLRPFCRDIVNLFFLGHEARAGKETASDHAGFCRGPCRGPQSQDAQGCKEGANRCQHVPIPRAQHERTRALPRRPASDLGRTLLISAENDTLCRRQNMLFG